jgi:hypothetical protein
MVILFKYFTIVGAALFGLLMLANFVLEPSGPKPSAGKATPKLIVEHDPRASLVERLRNEEAAQKAAASGETLTPRVTDAEPILVKRLAESATRSQAERDQVSAPAVVTTATPTEDAAARAVRLARKRIKAERIRKQRLARERARALEQTASQQQGQLYQGYAPQPTFGPFGGWGQVRGERW